MLTKNCFHSVDCHFAYIKVSFAIQKIFNLMESHLLILSFNECAISVLFIKTFPKAQKTINRINPNAPSED